MTGWSRSRSASAPPARPTRAWTRQQRAELDERCRELLGPPPFVLESVAWAARGVV